MSSIRLFQASVTDAAKFPFFHRLCSAFVENTFQDSPGPVSLQPIERQLLSGSQDECIHDTIETQDENKSGLVSGLLSHKRRPSCEPSSTLSGSRLWRSTKRFKRSSSHVDMSFVLSAKADRLRFSDKIAQLPSSNGQIKTEQHSPSGEFFWPESRQNDDEPEEISGVGPAEMAEGDLFNLVL